MLPGTSAHGSGPRWNGRATMTMPNFLVIGAVKSGTSALCNVLRQHPEVFVSPHKELHFRARPTAFMDGMLEFLGGRSDRAPRYDPTGQWDRVHAANRALHRTLLRRARPARALVPGMVRTWLFTRPPGAVPPATSHTGSSSDSGPI
jgi:hypothetical protein